MKKNGGQAPGATGSGYGPSRGAGHQMNQTATKKSGSLQQTPQLTKQISHQLTSVSNSSLVPGQSPNM